MNSKRGVRITIILLLMLVLATAGSGKFLVMDRPRKADVILVLAGDTDRRPARALELYRQGYAGRVILDVPEGSRIYAWTECELARKYIESLAEARFFSLCSIRGLSTREEARDVAACLPATGAQNVLLVTSDFHTRRTLSVFRKQFPGRNFAVAAAYDSTQFGAAWWHHRQWAKMALDEWLRLAWWEAVDRWRS
jgi:uncharacterized SAM-binding protein YcdF (DUF218 family)